MTRWSPHVEPCPSEARAAALQVLYRRIPLPLRPKLVEEVLHESACGLIDLSGLWVARERPWPFRGGGASPRVGSSASS